MIAHAGPRGKRDRAGSAPLWLALLLIFALWALSAAAVDLWGATRAPRGAYGAIVVAGAPARADGRPSGALARRAELGIALWRAGVAPKLAFTGGPGRIGHAEAEVAAALARAGGVPESALVVEAASDSTEGNARLSADLLGAVRILVVTDSYHALRCALVFRRWYPSADAVGARPPPWPRARMALREVLALGIYAARGLLHRR